MASKRYSPPVEEEEEEDGNGSQTAKRSLGLSVQDVVAELWPRILGEMERTVRRVVREELNANHVSQPSNQDKEIRYCLQFWNELPKMFFTFNKILAKDGTSLKIALTDSNSGEVITSGRCSSVEVEIVVIDGDFVSDGHEYLTEKQFKDHVVHQRDGKAPLLKGELIVKLNNGVGCLPTATFTDNSSWTKSQNFRLGVRLSQSECIEDKVQEGISEPFRVKDRRGELNQKYDSPSLTDEVWRLKHIMKDGILHKRLEGGGIHTVQEFLQAFTMNQEGLRSLLGDKAKKKEIPNKRWQEILTHARKCPLGNEHYLYRVPGQNVVLIFNSIYELIGALINDMRYSMGDVPAFLQQSVDNWKKLAFQNPKDIRNDPQHITPINVPFPGSRSVDPQIPYSNGKNDDISVAADKVQSIQESSSFQEPEVSNGLPLGSIPVHPSTATDTAFPGPILPDPENSDHPAADTGNEPDTDMGLQQIFAEMSNEQDFSLLQQPAFGRVDGCMLEDEGEGWQILEVGETVASDTGDPMDGGVVGMSMRVDQECLFDYSRLKRGRHAPKRGEIRRKLWVGNAGLKCGLFNSEVLGLQEDWNLCIVVSKLSSCLCTRGASCCRD